MQVIEAGYPLLVEKPLAFELSEAVSCLQSLRGPRLEHQVSQGC